VAGDFDGDGKLDLLIGSLATIGVSLGNGDGTFQPPVYYYEPLYPIESLSVADFNGDGRTDVAFSAVPGQANHYAANVLLGVPSALGVGMTHSGNFTRGQTGATYTVTVSNGATAVPAIGTVTVTLTVPSGLTLVSMAGTGWTCPGTAANNCTRSGALAAGTSYPAITVTVNVAANATSPQTNSVTVSGGGSASAIATDPTTITTSQTITFATLSNKVFGTAPFTVSATATSGLPVSFNSQTTPVCTVSVATVTLVSGGTCTIQATQAGNSSYAAATPVNQSFQVTQATPVALRFVPITPCRIADTRNTNGPFGGPLLGANTPRDFNIPASACGIPANAAAYSLNLTVVPVGPLGYLSVWPAGQTQPLVSTLNSLDGRIKANAAIVPAGINGAVTLYASDSTHAIIDINGYFVPASGAPNLAFYPVTPCRVADTRNPTGDFGGPALAPAVARTFAVPASSCGIPVGAQAYAFNMTVVPSGSLGFLTTWPAGTARPGVSTLNALTGVVTSNAAIVPAGVNGGITVYATNTTHLIIDINGYFAPPRAGSLDFYTATPCRVLDTRSAAGSLGGPTMGAGQSRGFPVPSSACGIPGTAKAYSLNATVVPPGPLSFLTLWGSGSMPFVSTLNATDGAIVANAALVPAGASGEVTAYTTNLSHLILDINGYFQ
jgi:hypothetical protein